MGDNCGNLKLQQEYDISMIVCFIYCYGKIGKLMEHKFGRKKSYYIIWEGKN